MHNKALQKSKGYRQTDTIGSTHHTFPICCGLVHKACKIASRSFSSAYLQDTEICVVGQTNCLCRSAAAPTTLQIHMLVQVSLADTFSESLTCLKFLVFTVESLCHPGRIRHQQNPLSENC